jgi:excisionase family DNA binding protein
MAEQLITIGVVAGRLGLTKRGVEGLVSRRVIPAFKISRRCLRFRWSDVQAAIEKYELRSNL